MFYIPVDSLEIAQVVSRSFYELSRPKSAQNPDDVSQYYSSWVEHPETKAVMLEIPDDDLYIHLDADEHIFDQFFQSLVESGVIKEQELIDVQEAIATYKEAQAQIKNLIPNYWKQQAKTREQLQQDGWFGTSLIRGPLR